MNFRRISGYRAKLKVFSLQLDVNLLKSFLLQHPIFKLNEIEAQKFLDQLGFSFSLLNDWRLFTKETNKSNSLESFLNTTFQEQSTSIKILFQKNPIGKSLVSKLKMEEEVSFLDFRFEMTEGEIEFLIDNNIIVEDRQFRRQWHDKLVENIFDEWKKDNFSDTINKRI